MLKTAIRLFALSSSLTLACMPTGGEEKKDAATACTDLCTKGGYSSSRVEEEANETNCFCSGGTGPVSDGDCTQMCTDLGKSNSQTFSATGGTKDSCQCS